MPDFMGAQIPPKRERVQAVSLPRTGECLIRRTTTVSRVVLFLFWCLPHSVAAKPCQRPPPAALEHSRSSPPAQAHPLNPNCSSPAAWLPPFYIFLESIRAFYVAPAKLTIRRSMSHHREHDETDMAAGDGFRSLLQVAGNGQASRRCAQRSSAWAARKSPWLHLSA
jgi:hypothetical protein